MKTVTIDGVEHPSDLTIRDRVFNEAWKVPVKKSDLPNQEQLDAISAKLAQDKWDKEYHDPATPFLRKEQMRLTREQNKHLDAIEREQQVKDHLESPRIAKRLAEAKALRDGIVNDPERVESEIIKADRIIATYSLPEGDFAVGDAMLNELREIDNEYRMVKAAVYRKQADEAERKFREYVSGVIDNTRPERIRVEGHDSIQRIDSLADKMAFATGYSMEDLETMHRARRAAVLQGDVTLAEAALAEYADMSPAIDQSGLEVTDSE